MPQPGIEPAADPLILLDHTLQQLVALLGVLARERQNLLLQRRELQGEWKKLHRLNSMVANANARAMQAAQDHRGDSSESASRKRPSMAEDGPLPVGWSKRSRSDSWRAERSAPSMATADRILPTQSGHFKFREPQAATSRVKWPYRDEEADKEVQFICGFPDDEIVEVQLHDTSIGHGHNNRSQCRGVSWIAQSQSWVARWSEDGKLRTKSFASRKYGYEKALEMAEEFKKSIIQKRRSNASEMKSEDPTPDSPEEPASAPSSGPASLARCNSEPAPASTPTQTSSQVAPHPSQSLIEESRNRGVYYKKSSKSWYVKIPKGEGKIRTKCFSMTRLGEKGSLKAAIAYRRKLDGLDAEVKPEADSTAADGSPYSQISSPVQKYEDSDEQVAQEDTTKVNDATPNGSSVAALSMIFGGWFYQSRYNLTPYPDRLAVIETDDAELDLEMYDGFNWWDPAHFAYAMKMMNSVRTPYFHHRFANAGLSPSNGRYLDVGCGGGLLTEDMASLYGYNITGIDISEASLQQARQHGQHLPNLHYQVGSAYEIPFEDNSFDGVIISDVFEHLLDLRKASHELYRVLKPGGILVFDTVARSFLTYSHYWLTMQEILRVLPPNAHDWRLFIDPSEMVTLLQDTGFSVSDSPESKWVGLQRIDMWLAAIQYVLSGFTATRSFSKGYIELPHDLTYSYCGVATKPPQ
ncbi:Hexaprenyldihydroxybenzoate methyltransferase, mitochondrial [Perkinsus chesapeaki]|uniref:Hexaprenyldihydroxybenzoate methyltransferase, mitochondrial n=1 Tax=Perkinsus chesapeaki TaxID=330153 RepID=A0A7J6KZC7_PERCH|nr:Hexaprenyldihydroxybenzoate methyltransferase, mitochondrial [Perkinsus chesapeaki]